MVNQIFMFHKSCSLKLLIKSHSSENHISADWGGQNLVILFRQIKSSPDSVTLPIWQLQTQSAKVGKFCSIWMKLIPMEKSVIICSASRIVIRRQRSRNFTIIEEIGSQQAPRNPFKKWKFKAHDLQEKSL